MENKRKATIITFVFNVLLLIGLYFMIAWRQPVPPMSQFGLELNLGFSDVGSGNEPSEIPPADRIEAPTESVAPGDPSPEPTKNATPVTPPKTEPTPAKSQPAKPSFESRSNTPSPVRGEEKPKNNTEQPKEKPDVQPAKPAVPEKESKPVPEKSPEEKPKVDPRAIFGAGGTRGENQKPSSGSNQGSSNQPGDEGNPQGTIDGRSILETGRGNAGDGAGYNLDLAGWDFASKPNIQDNVSNRNGKIVFRITVDDNGKIVQAIPLEYNVNNDVLTYYRTIVNKLSFKRQSGNPSAEYSTGRITFIIKVD
ncbi:MAG: energy transducer TonB [Cyclobacteriaceae bacterium]